MRVSPRRTWPDDGKVKLHDPFCEDSGDIYWKAFERVRRAGFDGWWMDATDMDIHRIDADGLDAVVSSGSQWRNVLAAYPLACTEAVATRLRERDNRRPFILTRSYFAGQQRTGANTWSGDVSSSWDSFRKQVPLCLNYTLTANPNVNTDIGGFFANAYNKGYADNSATKNPLYQELYVRWMQFGLFCPMMRSHGTEVFREIYHFGEPGEPVYDALLSAIKMRYEIMPYIYSQSWQVSKNDDSFMRALVMDFKDDRNVWNNNREYMFGHSFLVAPVVEALYTPESANKTNAISGWDRNNRSLYQDGFKADWAARKTYEVYLPKGAKWYDYWTGEKLEGGQTIKADAPISHSPLYVKAGSIIPLCKADVKNAKVADWKNLDIVVYPGENAEFTLYEDEGDNYNCEQGAYALVRMSYTEKDGKVVVAPVEGSYKGMKDFGYEVIIVK